MNNKYSCSGVIYNNNTGPIESKSKRNIKSFAENTSIF